jgi:hypothetical protein
VGKVGDRFVVTPSMKLVVAPLRTSTCEVPGAMA